MNRRNWSVLAGLAAGALAISTLNSPAGAAPAADPAPAKEPALATGQHRDDLPNPLGDKQRAERKAAVEKLVKGDAKVVPVTASG